MADVLPLISVMARRSRRFVWSVFRILLLVLVMLAWFQRSLIYHPAKVAELSAKRSNLPQAVIDVVVTSFDGIPLHGWLTFAGTKRNDEVPDRIQALQKGRPLVIVFCGNAGHRAYRDRILQAMGALGTDAMIFDYRGYGDNQGAPTEANFIRDARAIWKFATEELEIPATRIVFYGESLGGGTASRLAGDLGAEGIEPGGLILQSTFNSLVDTGRYHFPWLPVRLLLIDRFESQKHVTRARCPILQIHGKQDQIVPLSLGQKLFDAAPEKSASGVPKQQVLLPNTDHNDVYDPSNADIQQVMDGLREFLEGVQKRAKNP